MVKVSAVIPTYNGKALLEKHLDSVVATLGDGDELVLIDDASTDDTLEWLVSRFNFSSKNQFDEYRLLEGTVERSGNKIALRVVNNTTNLRFAAAVNRGVEQAQGNLIFLLNNDVAPAKNCRDQLLTWFEDDLMFGVGCMEYLSELGGEQAGKNKLWFERGRFIHAKADSFESGQTAWVSGGSGMFDRQKWLQLGGFDPRFAPAYWEDIDLSFRARLRGWRVLFDAEAIVIHHHETTNYEVFGQSEIARVSWRNGSFFGWKHASFWQRLQILMWWPYWRLKKLRENPL